MDKVDELIYEARDFARQQVETPFGERRADAWDVMRSKLDRIINQQTFALIDKLKERVS